MKRYEGEQLTRTVELDRSAVDEKKRTVSLSFSSEAPVERYFGTEILSHAPGAVDLSRLNSGGALLVEHDSRDMVGVVEKATIGADKVGRAVVRFGKSARAEEIFQDVLGNLRKLISVGYRIIETAKEAGDVIRATKWQPMEISFVAVPADSSVGVGRSHSKSHTPMSVEIISENSRAAEINAIAEHIGNRIPNVDVQQLAARAILANQSVEQFRAAVFSQMPNTQPAMACAPLEMRPKDLARYSLARAITQKLDGKLDGIEKELSDECALKHGRKAEGFFVPDEVMARNAIAGTPTLGGMLVQVDNRGDLFIEILRNKSQVINLGARVLNLSHHHNASLLWKLE